MDKLKGKIVWITGASSGIGLDLSIECVKRGSVVVITARREQILKGLSDKIKEIGGESLICVGDVCNLEQMQSIAAEIVSKFGIIDILIANAGDFTFTVPEQFDVSEYMRIMNLNYGGMLNCIHAVVPYMKDIRSGNIVGMASLAGSRGLPRAAAYGASKAAMHHFLESLRFHYEKLNIKVTIVNPGFVKTPLTDKNDFYMPFLIDSVKAAKIICDGIESDQKEISFPFPYNWIHKSLKFIPGFLYRPLIRVIWKLSEKGIGK